MPVLNESRPFGAPCSPDLASLLSLADYLTVLESGASGVRAWDMQCPDGLHSPYSSSVSWLE